MSIGTRRYETEILSRAFARNDQLIAERERQRAPSLMPVTNGLVKAIDDFKNTGEMPNISSMIFSFILTPQIPFRRYPINRYALKP